MDFDLNQIDFDFDFSFLDISNDQGDEEEDPLISLGTEESLFVGILQSTVARRPQAANNIADDTPVTASDFNNPPLSWITTPSRYNDLLKDVLQSVPEDSTWNLEEELPEISKAHFSFLSPPSTLPIDLLLTVAQTSINPKFGCLHLPDELLLQIFQYITPCQVTLNSCAEVCRQWNRCATPLLYYSPRFASTFHWALFIQTLLRPERLHSHGSLIYHVNLSERDQVNDISVSASSLVQLAFNCPKLISLNLSGCSIFRDTFWKEIQEYQSMLQHIPQSDLTRVTINYKHAIHALATRCPNLKELSVSNCDWVTVEVLHIIVRRFTSLEVLDLRKCAKILSKNITSVHHVHHTRENETILDVILESLNS
ncbi:hypothetical protein K7432_002993 [Basidiobolus ranarum]|uniref:F-box domain-containing protein n=1 Tax=Basidiobolus ranarum TaxID=34480 RepID=A0ABR2W740_9FUNG